MLTLTDILAWFGAFLFVSGGTKFYAAFSSNPQMVEINQWGLCFIPLAWLYLSAPEKVKVLTFSRVIDSLKVILDSKNLVRAMCLILGLFHFYGLYNRHLSFNSNWDLAIYANACSNGLHSSLRNNLSLLADHFEPALVLATPLCRLTDPSIVLLLTQVIAWLIGASGIRKLAIESQWQLRFAHGAQLLYLLFSSNQTISYYDFHLYGWSLATIPWIMYAIQSRRHLLLAALLVIHLGLKENTSLFVAGLGLWLFLQGRKGSGAAVSVLGIVTFILIMKVVYPHFRGGVESEYFGKYYGYMGSNLNEFVRTTVTKPWIPLSHFFAPSHLIYYVSLLAPFLFFPALSPSFLIPVAGTLLINSLSTSDFLYSGSFHYDAEIGPWFFASMIVLMKGPLTLLRWQRCAKVLRPLQKVEPKLLWFMVIILFFSSVSPMGQASYFAPTKLQAELHLKLRELAKKLSTCKVATVDRLSPHVADLPQLLSIDHVDEANAVIVAYPQGDRLWMMGVDAIERDLVPKLNQSFHMTRPLNHDSDFRVWVNDSCHPAIL